jgi:hypothetical protein
MAEGPGLETLGRRSRSERLRPKATALIAFLVAVDAIAAGRPEAEQAKIDWLLSEVGKTTAVFIRNGKEYDGAQAVAHLKMKLFFAGRRVQTVRQFTVAVASRSEASGKPYEIRTPDGKQGPLQKWLLERLSVYEKVERR